MDTGYIKIARKIFEWEWWGDPVTLEVFIWCILRANWKDGKFKGQIIPRGSFVTSREKGAAECRLSQQTWRTAIKRLISTNELTTKSTNKYTLITVVNYEVYQSEAAELTSNLTSNLTNNQPATNHNRRKKEIKNKEIDISSSEIEEIISYLNQKTGKNFRATTGSTKKHIDGRLKEGYSVEDFKRVIDVKCNQWLADSKMSAYLRPETLFAPSHFEAYLNEAPAPKPIQITAPEEEEEEMTDEEFFALVDSNFGEVG